MNYYDYFITLPETPAFSENIQLMMEHIYEEGTAPTIQKRNSVVEDKEAIGTKPASGKIMLHFRLNQLLEGTALTDWLEQGMSNPKPPLSIEVTRSSQKIIPVVIGTDPETGDIIEMQYDNVVTAKRATFLPFMNDVQDGVDGNGDPIMRPPNATDALFLSGYYGSQPIELI